LGYVRRGAAHLASGEAGWELVQIVTEGGDAVSWAGGLPLAIFKMYEYAEITAN